MAHGRSLLLVHVKSLTGCFWLMGITSPGNNLETEELLLFFSSAFLKMKASRILLLISIKSVKRKENVDKDSWPGK